ncbi:MAG: glutamate racemase [Bacteroidota bacterium]|nr:glutamate racemase [Flavobacteriia bacterium]NBP28381.1 glutamate racemase [Flavobacteriia bacterium]
MLKEGKIGVFDSGFGGLTVLRSIVDLLPNYPFIYFGDNARAPYGNKSFDLIYEYTLEGVNFLFDKGCEIVVLACNTASAKALRTIQQKDLPRIAPSKRVLGVIRPSTEEIASFTRSGFVGILGTEGTVKSESYLLELAKISPNLQVFQHACPLWVPLIEERQYDTVAGKMIIASDIDLLFKENKNIDTILLACTHYPIIKSIIQEAVEQRASIIEQGPLVALKLKDYLTRHPEMASRLGNEQPVEFYTTEREDYFNQHASEIYGSIIKSQQIQLS